MVFTVQKTEESLEKDYLIEELTEKDLTNCFFKTLASLSPAEFDLEKALKTFKIREEIGFKTFVYKKGGEVVGTTSLFIEPKYTHNFGFVGHIEDVVVMKEYQRQGIGSALIRYAINEARKAGCYKVILDRGEHTSGFYDKFGFKPHETGVRLDLE